MDKSHLSRFKNLSMLCKRDESQHKSLSQLAIHKPHVVESLDIYAQNMQEYIKEQRRRIQYLKKRENHSLHVGSSIIIDDPETLMLHSKVKAKQHYARKLKLQNHESSQSSIVAQLFTSSSQSIQNFNRDYTPLKRIERIIIPSLNPVTVSPPRQQKPLKLQVRFNYYSNEMNIKQAFKKRQNWVEVQQPQIAHFLWLQNQGTFDYGQLLKQDALSKRLMINYHEFQNELTNIVGLYNTIHNKNILQNELIYGLTLNFKQSSWEEDWNIIQDVAFPEQEKLSLGKLYKPTKNGQTYNNYISKLQIPESFNLTKIWIVKPQNIKVNSILELKNVILQAYNAKWDCKEFVIQKCLDKNHQINNQNYTVNYFVLVNQEGQPYLYKKCYGQQEDNKIIDGKELEFTWSRVYDIIYQLFQVCKINRRFRKYCMQLFEFVFTIDANQKVYLQEVKEKVNFNLELCKEMLDGVLKLTVDQVFENSGENEIQNWIQV